MVLRKATVHHSPFGAGRGKLSMLELRWEGTTTENALYMLVLTELKIGGPDPFRFTQPPNFQIETRMIPSSVVKGWGVTKMEWINEARLRCLLVSSKDPAHLKTVVAMLHAHEIQTEEGLHRPWRSASFESSIMVSPEDYPKASVLYKELEIPPGTGPALVSSLAPPRLMERGKRKLLPEFFAKPKKPEPTDFGRYLKNRASR
jgi:hypothetical protein